MVLYPVTLLRIAAKAAHGALAEIAENGTQGRLLDQMQTRDELYELLDYNDFQDRDRAYFSP